MHGTDRTVFMHVFLLIAFLTPLTSRPNPEETWRRNWLRVSRSEESKGPLAPVWHGESIPEPPKKEPARKEGKTPDAKPGAVGNKEKPAATKTVRTDNPPSTNPPRTGRGNPEPPLEDSSLAIINRIGWVTTEKGRWVSSEELDGQKCLDTLTMLKIPWRKGDAKRGMTNPVQLNSHFINGVYYNWYWGNENDLLLDCRMVLALYIAGPVFRKHGFDEIIYTSSYRYSRVSGTRRLSRHASGNALDVKALRGPNGQVAVVERDWFHWLGTEKDCVGPLPDGPARKMRELTCELETLPIFRRILSPDADYDHRNHFHFGGVAPGETWRRERICGRSNRRGLPTYKYVPVLKYPLPRRPEQLPPWPSGVDLQAPMPTRGSFPETNGETPPPASLEVSDTREGEPEKQPRDKEPPASASEAPPPQSDDPED